ncbi:hypothetical protein KCP78_01005 [Salmonella enterica subsp. enterica]|nr:hypothetical protein KCP78_01005 [Salmonella enterica subsp. enterica]
MQTSRVAVLLARGDALCSTSLGKAGFTCAAHGSRSIASAASRQLRRFHAPGFLKRWRSHH